MNSNFLVSRFPPSKYLVYAFQGAPGDYPSKQENHDIQKYIKFSKYIDQKSDEFIKDEMNGDPFVAIHLRNGGDMVSELRNIIQMIVLSMSNTKFVPLGAFFKQNLLMVK